ncbi:MAG: DUF3368 domain-containing protein [Armatimonadetes bacterium]|nr:DUF3368 domain-containing protein [Armatimonadota bacterium]
MIVVSDTGPLNYLILIDAIDLLPQLYGRVLLPPAVRHELSHPRAPEPVRRWIEHPPKWVEVRSAEETGFGTSRIIGELDPGEEEALQLALSLRADLLLIDDSEGRRVAREHGLTVRGTLGVLEAARVIAHAGKIKGLRRLRSAKLFLNVVIGYGNPIMLRHLHDGFTQ